MTRSPASDMPRLAVRSTAQVAADWLRDAIMKGDLKPGERLIEHKLASTLGIGQPTLREALKELELLGFVRKTPKRGTHVTKLTKDDFRNILDVRMALETLAIERAAARLTPESEKRLEECVSGMRAAAENFDLAEFHANDVVFHRVIWETANNDQLALALERIAFGLFAFVVLQREPDSKMEFLAATKQHEDILEGLQTRDPARAVEAFTRATLKYWNENHEVKLRETSRLCVTAD